MASHGSSCTRDETNDSHLSVGQQRRWTRQADEGRVCVCNWHLIAQRWRRVRRAIASSDYRHRIVDRHAQVARPTSLYTMHSIHCWEVSLTQLHSAHTTNQDDLLTGQGLGRWVGSCRLLKMTVVADRMHISNAAGHHHAASCSVRPTRQNGRGGERGSLPSPPVETWRRECCCCY